MRSILSLLTLCFLFSCHNDKVIQLPEIKYSDIHEILDVSPAYIFYDETKPDRVELNRKNLISTTNWLVNVDKRLTLEQVIPHIVFLQDKKRNAKMHKNEAAKNYFTCNDTSIKNLGFIEFTDLVYKTYNDEKGFEVDNSTIVLNIIVNSMDSIIIDSFRTQNKQTSKTLIKALTSKITAFNKFNSSSTSYTIYFSFNRSLSFQNYISIKSLLIDFKLESTTISKNEFIY